MSRRVENVVATIINAALVALFLWIMICMGGCGNEAALMKAVKSNGA